ncbi:MAG: hypothetical protein K1W34_13260 [Lachnospiraceae bacterium]
MLFVGIILGVIAVVWLNSKKGKSNEIIEPTQNVTGAKVVLFLIGIMVLAMIGGSKIALFSVVGDLAFVILILFLGYLLFKKLFMR